MINGCSTKKQGTNKVIPRQSSTHYNYVNNWDDLYNTKPSKHHVQVGLINIKVLTVQIYNSVTIHKVEALSHDQ